MSEQFREKCKELFKEAKSIKDEGRHVESLKKLDELQQIIKQALGDQAPELQPVYDEIAILCNILSMAHLQKEDYKLCQDLLKKAELFTENNERLKAITYNNYACLFRKTNKLRNALSYLEQALDLEYTCLNTAESTSVDESLKISNPCEIHLNICAILSQMGKHELALHHAMKALLLIQDELISRTSEDYQQQQEALADGTVVANDDRFTVMVIALHNIAVEHEYLKQYQHSLTHYKKAKDFAQSALGADHIMSKKMDMVFQQAAVKIFDQLEKQTIRKNKLPGTAPNKAVSQQSPRSLPLSIIGISLEELLQTGTLPDSTQEIESQFKGIAALNVPAISQTQPFGQNGNSNSNVVQQTRQQRSPTRVMGSGNPYTLKR